LLTRTLADVAAGLCFRWRRAEQRRENRDDET
jgi:hypothetical protein